MRNYIEVYPRTTKKASFPNTHLLVSNSCSIKSYILLFKDVFENPYKFLKDSKYVARYYLVSDLARYIIKNSSIIVHFFIYKTDLDKPTREVHISKDSTKIFRKTKVEPS